MRISLFSTLLSVVLCLSVLLPISALQADEKPLFKDFMGINGHYKFRAELYRPVCEQVRNYHNLSWDAEYANDSLTFPVAKNGVRWLNQVYRPWHEAGFGIDVCIQMKGFAGDDAYAGLEEAKPDWLESYAYDMASRLGSEGEGLVESIEIGNEPGNEVDDRLYLKIFESMARGIRRADPSMKILTCTAHAGAADKYSKSLQETFAEPEIQELYDVINVHRYATLPQKKGRSPWARSYPEDPELDHLRVIDATIAWRDAHAADKVVWLTEFGYDAPTKKALDERSGWAKKLDFRGNTEEEQARYLVRSYFAYAQRDLERAYIYFYDDSDKASVHAASGLTRNFIPKPAYFAVRHLYQLLGEYRLERVVRQEEGGVHVLAFIHGTDPGKRIWAAWLATGESEQQKLELDGLPGRVSDAEAMPYADGAPPEVTYSMTGDQRAEVTLSETPVYLMFGL